MLKAGHLYHASTYPMEEPSQSLHHHIHPKLSRSSFSRLQTTPTNHSKYAPSFRFVVLQSPPPPHAANPHKYYTSKSVSRHRHSDPLALNKEDNTGNKLPIEDYSNLQNHTPVQVLATPHCCEFEMGVVAGSVAFLMERKRRRTR